MIRLIKPYYEKIFIFGDQGIVSGVNFLLSIFIVRKMGIHIFGEFSILLIVILGVLAISQSVVSIPYQSLSYNENLKDYTSRVKGIQVIILSILAFVIFGTHLIVSNTTFDFLTFPFLPTLLYTIGFILFDFNRKHMYVEQLYILCFFKDAFTMLSQLLIIGFILSPETVYNLEGLLWVLSMCFLVIELPVFLFFRIPKIPKLETIKNHWHFGKWLSGNAVLQWFSGNFFITVGATLLGADVVGIVRIGQSIIGVWNVLIQALENYVPPLAAKIYTNKGWMDLSKYLVAIGVKGGILISCVGIFLVLFRDSIWELFYGKEQIEYSYILFWFAPILLLNFLGFPYRFAIRTINKTRVLFEAYILSAIFGFTTAHLFVLQFNIHGICLGLLLTQVIMQLWYMYKLNKFSKCESSI